MYVYIRDVNADPTFYIQRLNMLENNNSARIGRNPSKCPTTQKAPTANSALELTECGR